MLNNDEMLDSVKRINEGPIWGVVGIINLSALNYLVVINNASVAAKLNNVNIYKVTGIRIIPFKVSFRFAKNSRMARQLLQMPIC